MQQDEQAADGKSLFDQKDFLSVPVFLVPQELAKAVIAGLPNAGGSLVLLGHDPNGQEFFVLFQANNPSEDFLVTEIISDDDFDLEKYCKRGNACGKKVTSGSALHKYHMGITANGQYYWKRIDVTCSNC